MIFRFGTIFFQDPQLDGNFRPHFRDHGIIKTCGINRSRSVELVLKNLMENFHRSSENEAGKKNQVFSPVSVTAGQDSFKGVYDLSVNEIRSEMF